MGIEKRNREGKDKEKLETGKGREKEMRKKKGK